MAGAATASVKGVNIPLEVAVIQGPYVDSS
jgi:hypothetical protein